MLFLYILLFVFILGLLICIHEYGHFYFAKKAGILCHEFSFGMGPLIWKKKVNETTYSIRAIPIGGYVMMAGETEEQSAVKIDQEIRLRVENDGEVSGIIFDINNEKYQNCPLVKVEKFDLLGEAGNDLYINEYKVKRDAYYIYANNEMQIAPYDRLFSSKTLLQRFKSIVAGPLNNILLAIGVFILLGLIVGVADTNTSYVGEVDKASLAYEILLEGDKVISVDGVSVENWNDITTVVTRDLSNRVHTFVVLRDGEEVVLNNIVYSYSFVGFGFNAIKTENYNDVIITGTVVSSPTGDKHTNAYEAGLRDGDKILSVTINSVKTDINNWTDMINLANSFTTGGEATVVVLRNGVEVTCEYNSKTALVYGSQILDAQGLVDAEGNPRFFVMQLGVSLPTRFSLGYGILNGLYMTWNSATMIFKTLGALFTSDQVGVSDLGGPLGIFDMTASYASQGFESILNWVGLLSVNLGVMNLLPIPALDGGRLVFVAYEAITKKKPNKKVENALITATFILLMILFVYVSFNDVIRMFFK